MSALVAAILVGFAIGLFLLFGAVIELYRGLEQIRLQTGVIDSPVHLELDLPMRLPEDAGLPDDLLRRRRGLILILSDRSTCGTIAEHLGGALPTSTWLLFVPQSKESGEDWLSRYRLAAESRVLVDGPGNVSKRVGVNITPSVLRIQGGTVVAAHTLPSARRLDDELAWLKNDNRANDSSDIRPGTIWGSRAATSGDDVEVLS